MLAPLELAFDGTGDVKVMWSICCVTCDASVRGSAQTEASAYEAWNRRTPHTGLKGAQA